MPDIRNPQKVTHDRADPLLEVQQKQLNVMSFIDLSLKSNPIQQFTTANLNAGLTGGL